MALATGVRKWRGVDSLREALVDLHSSRYELLTTFFGISLAQGLVATGRADEAIIAIDEAIALVEGNGDVSYMPELLRVKGNIFLSTPRSVVDDAAETCLLQSLEWSRRQGA